MLHRHVLPLCSDHVCVGRPGTIHRLPPDLWLPRPPVVLSAPEGPPDAPWAACPRRTPFAPPSVALGRYGGCDPRALSPFWRGFAARTGSAPPPLSPSFFSFSIGSSSPPLSLPPARARTRHPPPARVLPEPFSRFAPFSLPGLNATCIAPQHDRRKAARCSELASPYHNIGNVCCKNSSDCRKRLVSGCQKARF